MCWFCCCGCLSFGFCFISFCLRVIGKVGLLWVGVGWVRFVLGLNGCVCRLRG